MATVNQLVRKPRVALRKATPALEAARQKTWRQIAYTTTLKLEPALRSAAFV